MRFVASENDVRALPAPEATSSRRVSVVVPVFNRVALLERVVAGLAMQDHPAELVEVIVADDGSSEDVAGAMAPWRDRLDLTVARRDHEGYGAGQARNLGATIATGDVLLFVDADCLPARDLVRRHAAWHDLADNLVVVGARHDLDTTDVTPQRILEGDFVVTSGDGAPPSDWRALFYRRTARLQAGDEAYRAVVSNNLSVRREVFFDVGGFSEDFVRWGGEDTELGWRLSRQGCFIIADDGAVVHHQVQEDGEEGWREVERARNDGIVRTKIPHRFYRHHDPTVIHEVPKVSWVTVPTRLDAVEQLWVELQNHAFTDWELVLHDPDGELGAFRDLRRADPRLHVATGSDPLAAIGAARGEVVVLLHGAASPDRHASARLVRRLDARPRTQVVTVGAAEQASGEATLWTTASDVANLGEAFGLPWPPLVAVRGREIAKVLPQVGDLPSLWSELGRICDADHLGQVLVAVPNRGSTGVARPIAKRILSRRRVLGDVVAGDEAPRTGVVALLTGVRDRVLPPERPEREAVAAEPAERAPAGAPIPVRYVGWTGHDNVGDEAMLAAAQQLLPWADISTKGEPGRLLVLGGGTLINRFSYLRLLREKDSPRIERAVLGTGVASPEFWGQTESGADWAQWLGTCAYVGVRGPDSLDRLRAFGYEGPAEIAGDLALALTGPDVERVGGRLVIAPVHTKGKLHGGDDRAVLGVLGDLVGTMVAEGRDVHLLACHPADDRWCFEMMRRGGRADLPYTAGYDDLGATLQLLGSADVVVAERLHAGVLAAATGTPFIPVEYRPKTRDFARSVAADDLLLRTDELSLEALLGHFATIDRDRSERVERTSQLVETYRARLREASRTIEGTIR